MGSLWGKAPVDRGAAMADADDAPASAPGNGVAPVPVGSRDKILDISEALFARRGYAGVGLREVAERVGLGKSSLFHHFRSKGELYLAVLQRVFERIEERVAPSFDAPGSPPERLERGMDALIDALAEHPSTARLLLRGLFEDDDLPPESDASLVEAERALERLLGRLLSLLREGVETGHFRPVSPPHVLQTLIGAVVYHFASGEFGEALVGGPLFSSDAVRRRKDEINEMLRRGLAPDPAPAVGRRTT
jgi:AcrR family transcriptional regulator